MVEWVLGEGDGDGGGDDDGVGLGGDLFEEGGVEFERVGSEECSAYKVYNCFGPFGFGFGF